MASRKNAATGTDPNRDMTCDVCNHGMKRDEKEQDVTIKGQTRKFMQPGWYCTHCDNVVLSASDNDVFDREAMELRAEVEGVLSGDAIKLIRTQIFQISQEEASAMFGGGENSFAKYESHQTLPTISMSQLIKMAVDKPSVFEALKAKRVPSNTEIKERIAHVLGMRIKKNAAVNIVRNPAGKITLVAKGEKGQKVEFTPRMRRFGATPGRRRAAAKIPA